MGKSDKELEIIFEKHFVFGMVNKNFKAFKRSYRLLMRVVMATLREVDQMAKTGTPKRFYVYGNFGSIDHLKKAIDQNTLLSFGTYSDMVKYVNQNQTFWNPSLQWYGFDERIGFDVYVLTADHSGLTDQFLSYVLIK